ncbi:MAG: Oligopeptide transport system permease protein OppB [Firmicutes bacterium ADurb.Bin248]|nr:MAG: Oligopeptide transport system permease protein OppB [Firmicutes bacterium ADurb.Bin248]
MEIIKYILGRIGRSIISLFLVLVIVFLLMRLLPVETYYGDRTDRLSETTKQAILKDLGLLDPIPVQFWNYLKGLARFDLGKSLTYYAGKPVWSIMAPKIGYSLRFGAASLVISFVLGISLGILMVRTKEKLPDRLGNGFIIFVDAVPSMVYYLAIQFIGTKLMSIGMLYKENNFTTWILPVLSLSLGSIASYAMWTRRYMMDQVNADYVKLARAKGLTDKQIMVKHVLRNAFTPMAQNLPSSIIFTISGSLYIESLYSIPGTGGLLINAIQAQDNTLVQMLVMFYAVLSVAGMLLGDLAMMVCDPRITFTKKGGAR